jgi:phenylacetate-CoA ligase
MTHPRIATAAFRLHALYERNGVPGELARLEKSQWLDPGALAEIRDRRLRALMDHIARHNPHYCRLWAEHGLSPGQIRGHDDLARLPIMTREHLQGHWQEMISTDLPAAQIVRDQTGGSSGKPLRFAMDRRRYFSRVAATYRHDRWAGWDFGRRTAVIWGHPQAFRHRPTWRQRLRHRLFDTQIALDSSSLTAESMAGFVTALRAYRPTVLIGYANSVYLFARFLQARGLDLPAPRSIITSAEVLGPERRRVIEDCFGCPVFDRYGSRETSVIASECEAHEGLHICAEHLVVEVERGGKPAGPGEHGRILITDLSNLALPMIRYRNEDLGVPLDGPCACGRGLPRMAMAAGRETDFLVTPAGQLVSGVTLATYLTANAPGIQQAQLLQERPEEFTVRLVAGSAYGPETEDFFRRQIPKFVGAEMAWRLELVDRIEPLPSGKLAYCISRVDPASVW